MMNKAHLNMTLWRQRGDRDVTIPMHVKPRGIEATKSLVLHGTHRTDIVGTGMLEGCLEDSDNVSDLVTSLRLSAHDNRTIYIAMTERYTAEPNENWYKVHLHNPRTVLIGKSDNPSIDEPIAKLSIDDKSHIIF